MIDELAVRAAIRPKPSLAARIITSVLFVVLDVIWIVLLAWPFKRLWNVSLHALWPSVFPSLGFATGIMLFLLVYMVRLATKPTIVEV